MQCDPIVYDVSNVSSYVVNAMGSRCLSDAILIPTAITYSIIFIVGTIGNICTCLVVIRNKSMHTHTNVYLVSLALSDLLVLFLGLPMEFYAVIGTSYPYEFGEWICKGRAYLIEFTSYASILVICSFTVERWLAICHPLRSQFAPKISRAYMTVIIMWIISAFAALPIGHIVIINRLPLPPWGMDQPWTSLVSDDFKTVKDTEFCAMDVTEHELQKRLIYIAFLAFFMAPALLITMMYSHIAMRIASNDSLLGVVKEARMKANQNVIKMLISVVVSFFLCWLPFHIQRLLSLFITDHEGNVSSAVETVASLVYFISGCCYYSNSAINPILYNLFSQKYRKAFSSTILGNKITKKIRPQWYTAKSSAFSRRSNLDNSSHGHRTTGNSTKRLIPQKQRYLDCSDIKTAAILV
ncbi:hypothetical protein RB195_020068 [Necator americanus]|uniref:G-protein coupled receptors family 1 profile domain-containing protein n=1 Tax=Necator americanus TaxID=51031 RepID=A0ABR1CH34_NECAM